MLDEEFTSREWAMIVYGLNLMVKEHLKNAERSSKDGETMYLHAAEKYNELIHKVERIFPSEEIKFGFAREYQSIWIRDKK